MIARPVRISLVEDNAGYAEELIRLLRSCEGFSLLDCCGTAEDAIRILPTRPPDVALVDMQLPGLSGVECLRQLTPILPATAFVVLTSLSDDRVVFDALRAGAVGYLVKSAPSTALLTGIRAASEGDSPISPLIARFVVQYFSAPQRDPDIARLSKQESAVLEALARGDRYKEICASLSMNEHTMRSYIRRVYQKLSVSSRTEAVARFLRDTR